MSKPQVFRYDYGRYVQSAAYDELLDLSKRLYAAWINISSLTSSDDIELWKESEWLVEVPSAADV